MVLEIDPRDFNKIVFTIFGGKKAIKKIYKVVSPQAHDVLEYLSRFLKEKKIKLKEIKKIKAHVGEGSFTGVRMGVTIAKALSLALNIPAEYIK